MGAELRQNANNGCWGQLDIKDYRDLGGLSTSTHLQEVKNKAEFCNISCISTATLWVTTLAVSAVRSETFVSPSPNRRK